jgi:anti-sigma regulatory factor (Ser/Thr protein kinase)
VLLEILTTSKPMLLSVVRGAVERLADTLGFPAEQCRAVTLAVDEAMTNIIRHAYGGREDQTIAVYFRKARRRGRSGVEEGIEIVLHDSGPAIDRAKLCGRDLDDIRPGGLGLHFIEESMDIVKYKRAGKINEWRLAKYIKTEKKRKQFLEEKNP